MKPKNIIALLLCILLISSSGCSANTVVSEDNSSETNTQINAADMFSGSDKEIGYDDSSSVPILLQDTAAEADSADVTISENTVTITNEGTYIVSGNLVDGQIIVDAEKTDKVQLVLNGVNINSSSAAAIYVKQADKVFVTLATESQNTLSVQGEFVAIDENNIDAVIYSKDDLTLNGQGTLTIETKFGHGIVSKDDLVLTSGSYRITASGQGLSGKDSVRIADGSYTITTDKDGIHSENADDTTLGIVYIAGGSLEIASGDDAIHAANNVTIDAGTITVATSYEGIEGQSIDINGGTIDITSSDDGLNAAGGNDASGLGGGPGDDRFAADANSYISISGGIININAEGDGVDSNGSLLVSGGEIYVSGPTNNGNGALDYNGTAKITGGIFVAADSSAMAQNFGEDSTQGSMLVNTQSTQNGTIVLKDSNGSDLISFTPKKQYSSAVISAPAIDKGESYTVTMGTDSQIIEMTSLIYGSGGMNPGMGNPGTEKPQRHKPT